MEQKSGRLVFTGEGRHGRHVPESSSAAHLHLLLL